MAQEEKKDQLDKSKGSKHQKEDDSKAAANFFVSNFEGQDAVDQFKWSKYEIKSSGWSGTCIASNSLNYLFIQVESPPNKWCNEIHISQGFNWRKDQVFGYLDDGKLYSKYGTLYKDNLSKWNNKGDTCGVILHNNNSKISFYVNDKCQISIDLGNLTKQQRDKLILTARVHPYGHLKSIALPKFE